MKKIWIMLPLIALAVVACGKKEESAPPPLPAPAVAPSLTPMSGDTPVATPDPDKAAETPTLAPAAESDSQAK